MALLHSLHNNMLPMNLVRTMCAVVGLAFVFLFSPSMAHAEVNQVCLAECKNKPPASCITDDGTQSIIDSDCVDRECDTRCGQSPNPTSGAAVGANVQVRLLNPIGLTDPRLIVGRIIKGVLSIIGTITLAMFMYGGVLWLTSMGESDKVEKGKKIFVWTTLGLAIIAGAYTAVNAIMQALSTGSITGA